MKSRMLSRWVLSQGLVGTLAVSATCADTKWYDAVTMSGYLQASYVGNLNKPTDGSGGKVNNVGRLFDTDSNGFNFNTFLLQIAKPVGEDKVGFTTRFRTGQDATVVSGNSSNFWVQEAYLTYAATSKLSVIGGKFVTPFGYELVDSVSNPNFSEGLLYTFAEPVTHTGLKANYVFSEKVNATLGVVNGWDTTNPDNNTAKTLLWQTVVTPTKKVAWFFQGLYGKELPDPTNSTRLSLDTVVTLAATEKLSFAGQLDWGQQTVDPNTSGTTHWSGAGLWATFAETAKTSTSVRFEVLADQHGANRFGATAFADGSTNQTVKDITLTQKYMLTSNMGVRGEYRHDWSNQAYFVRHDGSAVRVQNTISADWFLFF